MNTLGIRKKLHNFIDNIKDRKAEAIYTLFENELDTEYQRKKLILAEREMHLRGEGRSYTPNEVRQMAIDKSKRNAL